ncbi:Protein-glutamine gamma-glutamyltransferase E [Varanus komodoensis]|nr:Protein-glutamine gamma-glutamyltransferase E [Varanus komodoensis]
MFLSEKRIPITIPYAEYKQHLTSDNMIQATALCRGAAGRLTVVKGVFALGSPPILIKVLGQAKVGEVARVEVTLTNPLDEDLQDCKLRAEGSDLTVDTVEIALPPVKARACSHVHLDIVPRRSGTKHLVVSFSSDKLQHINAFEAITVDE